MRISGCASVKLGCVRRGHHERDRKSNAVKPRLGGQLPRIAACEDRRPALPIDTIFK